MSTPSTTTVGDFVTLRRGTTYKGSQVGQPGPALLGLASIQPHGGFRRSGFDTYGGDCPPSISLGPGDLYVSLKDVTQSASLLGAVSRLPKDISSGRLTQDTVGLTGRSSGTPWSYLYWLLRTPQYRNFCWRYATGTTTLGLAREDFLSYPVPELTSERQAAVNLLDSIEAKMEILHSTARSQEEMARGIFKSWFVDFDPVRAKSEGLEPQGMDAATAALFPDGFSGADLTDCVPLGWKMEILGNVISVLEIGGRPKGGVAGVSDGIPSVGAESIIGIGQFNFGKTKYISEKFFVSMRKGHVIDGDVLLYKDGGRPGIFIPHVTMVGEGFPFKKFAINEHVYRIRAASPISQSFLYFWLTSDFADREMRNRGTGVAIPGLNSTALRGVPILRASDAVHYAFERSVEPLCRAILLNAVQSRSLAELRDVLLGRLVSGEFRAPEADKLAEAVL